MEENNKEKKPLGEKNPFEDMLTELKEQNAQSAALKNSSDLQGRLQQVISDKSLDLTLDQTSAINGLVDSLKSNKFDDLEARQEANARAEETLKLLEAISDNTKAQAENLEKIEGPGAIGAAVLGGLVVAVTTFIQGFILGIKDAYMILFKGLKNTTLFIARQFGKLIPKSVKTGFGNLVKSISNTFAALRGNISKSSTGMLTSVKNFGLTIKNFFSPITNMLKNIKASFAAGFAGLEVFRKTTGQFGKLGFFGRIGSILGQGFNFIKAPFTAMGKAFEGLRATFGGAKGGGFFVKITNTIGATVKSLMGFFGKVGAFASGLGRTLGRLFLPLTIALSAFDFIKGAVNDFVNRDGNFIEKLASGFAGGVQGLLVGLVGKPLDLLKDAVGWIGGKLGFENFKEVLANFSFAELISSLMGKIRSGIQSAFDFIGNLFTEVIPELMSNIKNSFINMAKRFGNFVKAMADGTMAAAKAMLPGGRKPGEEFSRVFKSAMDAGTTSIPQTELGANIQVPGSNEGEILSQNSRELDDTIRQSTTDVGSIVNSVQQNSSVNRGGDSYVFNTPAANDSITEGLANR